MATKEQKLERKLEAVRKRIREESLGVEQDWLKLEKVKVLSFPIFSLCKSNGLYYCRRAITHWRACAGTCDSASTAQRFRT